MNVTKDTCRDFLIYPFTSNEGLVKVSIDYSRISHEELVENLEKYLRYQVQVLPDTAQVGITHGSSEHGIDLLTDFHSIGLKVGWQVKSWNDLEQKTILDNVLAQVQKSKVHRLDLIVFVLAGDPNRHSGKISTIISNLSMTANRTAYVISPSEFAATFDDRNLNLMRAKGVSRLLQMAQVMEPDQPSMIPDPGPLNAKINNDRAAIFVFSQAKQFYDDGLDAVSKGDLALAEELFSKAHEIEPSADTLNALGNIQMFKGCYPVALSYYRQSKEIDPTKVTSSINMAVVLLRLGLYEEALTTLEEWIGEDQPNASAILLHSKILARAGKKSEAYQILKEKEPLIKPSGNDLLEFASQAYDQGDYNVALGYYSAFRVSSPRDVRGHWGEALCYSKLETLEKAHDCIQVAVRISPNNPQVRSILACFLRDLGRKDEALIEFEKARSLAPSSIEIVGNLANLLRDVGRPLEALEYYEQLLNYYPYDPLLWENRGNALSMLGLDREAFISKMAAVRISKEPSAELINDAGQAARKAGRTGDAVRLYNMSIERNPGLWHPKSNLASIMLENGLYERTKILLQEGIAAGDDSARAHTMLASCLIELRQYDAARKEAKTALVLEHDFPPAIGTLGLIEEETGNLKEASVLYERAIVLDNTLDFVRAGMARLGEKGADH
jgi:tetratricopeptide (TPR) repeat protein